MIGSPQQLGQILFEKLGLSRKRRGKTGFSTDARVLQAIRDEHPIIPKIERFRELSKLVQTYLDALPNWIGDDGRLHTTFLQVNAATGRLASINPNLQNIPIRTETGREIRGCFIAEPGNCLISVDYSQVELRILAHIADEQVLRDIFLRGEDVHTETAAAVFDTAARASSRSACAARRRWSTTGSSTASPPTGSPTACRSSRTRRRSSSTATSSASRPSRASWPTPSTQAEEHGYVSTLFGRRRQIPEIRARNWQTRKLGERLAVNSVIQGTAADIIKVAMVRSHDALRDAGLQTRCILQIHDELLFEGPIEEAEQATEIVAPRDGRRRRDGPAARGRVGRRPELAGREVVDRGVAVVAHRRRRRVSSPSRGRSTRTSARRSATSRPRSSRSRPAPSSSRSSPGSRRAATARSPRPRRSRRST